MNKIKLKMSSYAISESVEVMGDYVKIDSWGKIRYHPRSLLREIGKLTNTRNENEVCGIYLHFLKESKKNEDHNYKLDKYELQEKVDEAAFDRFILNKPIIQPPTDVEQRLVRLEDQLSLLVHVLDQNKKQ